MHNNISLPIIMKFSLKSTFFPLRRLRPWPRNHCGKTAVLAGFTCVALFLLAFFPAGGAAETDLPGRGHGENLVVGINSDFAPYEYRDKEGQPSGFTVELLKAAAEYLEVDVDFVPDDWKNIMDGLETGKLDIASGMLYSRDREKKFEFSIAHSTVSYSLFVRKDSPIRQFDQLRGKEIIVVQDVYAHEWLRDNTSETRLIPVSSSTEALQLLATGKHDCTVLPRLHGMALLTGLGIENIEIIGPAGLEQKFAFAVAAGNADLLADLNDALFHLQMSGRYKEIFLEWFSVEEKRQILKKIMTYLLPALVIIAALFALIISCNRLLKRAVDRKTAEIEESARTLSQILTGIPVPTFVVDCRGVVTHWNRGCEVLTGQSEEAVVGTKAFRELLYPGYKQAVCELLLADKLTEKVHRIDGVSYRRSRINTEAYEAELYFDDQEIDGQWYYVTAAVLRDSDGAKLGVIESLQDLTEIKQLERQLIQSQKMEALGTLAGGVVHDFNNILVSIVGAANLAARNFKDNAELQEYLELILSGGRRGRDLTGQILAYTSKAKVEPQRVSITAVVEEALSLLQSTCPKNIEVKSRVDATRELTADPTHIHQVMINLCTNAIHAMGEKDGELEIILDNLKVDQAPASVPDLAPGDYIRLKVTDNGPGMEASVRKRIFDPFFTTKKRGEGTGMGLSVTAGIIKQYGGTINCTTRLHEGTSFEVFFPVDAG